ncbi:MAG TPA: beta-N-acetylhexosaminidase [Candidatus Limiplasma sp.]|nr:beta-N-acetylhexosaminidase [Candidatus Limiplasma sp.]HPS81897.1 beta-N-acetylhexosaminidase [Candidatus Limiplasma sp.]
MDMQTALGQHLVTGFQGPEMTREFIDNVRSHKIGNVILFEYNVVDKVQLKNLCEQIRALVLEATGYPPMITIDQEGGAVSRLKEDATIFPSAMAVAATGNPENARIAGRITGEELLAMGVNFNLAPVMDVNSNPNNPVIGVRSYGDTPAQVARYGVAMAQGLMESGVLCSLKHFPGHGDTAVDSHLGLPCVDKSLEELLACELLPFQAAIDAGVPAVMTTHILFPRLEPDGVPATMSRRILTDLLKTRMGFQGLVISDCMMMGAIAQYYGTVKGSVAALRAGVDLVFVSHSASLASQALEAAQKALEDGMLDAAELQASTEKILRYKAAMPHATASLRTVGCAEHRALSAQITRDAITLVHDAPFALGDRPLFLGCYRFRPTMASSPEDASLSFADALRQRLGGDARITPQDPTQAEIAVALAHAGDYSSLTIGTYNARLRKGQLQLVREAAKLNLPVCVVALRNPYDLAELPENVRAIAAYDYDIRTLPILAEILAGRLSATGTLPVQLR